jgi:predicted dienelactone hydrolase
MGAERRRVPGTHDVTYRHGVKKMAGAMSLILLVSCASSKVTSSTVVVTTAAPAVTLPATIAPPAPTTAAPAAPPAPTTAAPAATIVSTTTAAPAAWAPVPAGKFAVGVATIKVDDPAGVRPLTVDVWFPLAASVDKTALSPQRYTLLPEVYYQSPLAFAAKADQIATTEKFPLVVYSHGSGGLRYIHSSYTEALASNGYVVVAPDHTGNTAAERITNTAAPVNQIEFNRPTDVRRVIDAFLDPAHPSAGPYAAHVDADKVVVTGHSFGGFTTIAMATGYTNDLGTTPIDKRVKAIIPIAPAASKELLPDASLASLSVPMMVLVGTNDKTTPVDPNVTRLWSVSTNAPAYRVELVAGQHQTFTDICAYQAFLPKLANVPAVITSTIDSFAAEGCAPGDINAKRAAELTNSYVVRFLDQVLHNGPALSTANPKDVIFAAR